MTTVDEYILQFPVEVQAILQTLRKLVKDISPEAEEKMSYQMPTYYLKGN
ncbi:MAG: iron chaperone, partial [Candidatus Paceibacteria bacterium]